jgi:hypothetical protein
VLAELSRQGIPNIPPSNNGSVPNWHVQVWWWQTSIQRVHQIKTLLWFF